VPQPAIEEAASAPRHDIKAWWVGHATVLVEMGDRWILTDPMFSDRLGMVLKRNAPPGVDLDALPEVDWVLISHAHMDHLDHRSLYRLNESARLAVPPGVVPYLPKIAFSEVAPLAPWRAVERDGIRVTAVPVRHGNGRFLLDELFRRDAHTGYVVEYSGMTVFFAGDTGYDPEYFKAIGARWKIDLALIPVAPAGSRLFRPFIRRVHVNPEEALRIFDDTHARYMIPIHHSTFFAHGHGEMDEITSAIARYPQRDHVLLLRAGESAVISRN
jgi:L-ascorbate metabolism protein UlaG (beta-lactamase superfamily)